jgi:hypothetical protein
MDFTSSGATSSSNTTSQTYGSHMYWIGLKPVYIPNWTSLKMPYDVVGKKETPTINLDKWSPEALERVSTSGDWSSLFTALDTLPPLPQANPSFRGSEASQVLYSNTIIELGDDSVDRISTQIMGRFRSDWRRGRHDFSLLSSILILYVICIIILTCVRRFCTCRPRENNRVVLPAPQSVGGALVLEANTTPKKEMVYL